MASAEAQAAADAAVAAAIAAAQAAIAASVLADPGVVAAQLALDALPAGAPQADIDAATQAVMAAQQVAEDLAEAAAVEPIPPRKRLWRLLRQRRRLKRMHSMQLPTRRRSALRRKRRSMRFSSANKI